MSNIARKLRIEGRVQGVWYRAWMVDQAKSRGLRGWVRNRTDKTVEAAVLGPKHAVDELIRVCHKGPIAAKVTAVKVTDFDPKDLESQTGFEKRPTA